MRSWWLPLSLACLLAGCAEGPVPPAADDAPDRTVGGEEDPWMGGDRILAVDWHAETTEFDIPACVGGGGIELEREGPIAPGTERLEVTLETDETWTGLQAGYSLDGGRTITWLPTVRGGPETHVVPVTPEQWETDEDRSERWSFHHQMNLPEPASQECYTGGGSGAWDVVVAAIRGADEGARAGAS
jgi:hypothetical protein